MNLKYLLILILLTVDPKSFDENSFVDVKSPVCLHHFESDTHPNSSFALASTIEYFRIPRNVLTINCF